ncbi:hypothetical protein Q0O85_19315 [Priestia megaterium]|uniref:hypothetical protein n=1 Tax=Priestia megaterium TaxID=1404 RepID=UPI0034573F39
MDKIEKLSKKKLEEDYYTPLQLAKLLGITAVTVRKHLAFKAYLFGSHWFFLKGDVQILIDLKNDKESKENIVREMKKIGDIKKDVENESVSKELTKDFYTISETAEKLGIEHKTASRFFDAVAVKTPTRGYIPKHEVERMLEIKENTRRLPDVIAEVLEEIGIEVTEGRINRHKRVLKRAMNDLGITLMENVKTPFNYQLLVNRAEEEKIKEFIRERIMIAQSKHSGDYHKTRFKIMVGKASNPSIPITMEEFGKFGLIRISENNIVSFNQFETIYQILLTLKKELIEHDDKEIESLIAKLNYIKTNGQTIREFTYFINKLKNKYVTKYIKNYEYSVIRDKKKEQQEVKPYTEEQFLRFGVLLLNETHQWFEEYIEKAIEQRLDASIWLYCLLHYVCAWRSIDMFNLPFPKLPIDESTGKPIVAEKFIELVKNRQVTEVMAGAIVKGVKVEINYNKMQPQKTRRHNPPNLVFEPPTSVQYRLGELLGLCEAHRQLSKNKLSKKRLLIQTCKERDKQQKFFGPEFADIFKNKSFTNASGAKTYMNLMAKKADEKRLGSGYVLASIARSHKFTPGKLSDTTAIYLKHYSEMTESETLMRELFERGVCSFVPFLLLKTLEGEEAVRKLTRREQTEKMKELIPYSPYDGERMLMTYDKVIEKAKIDVQKIINHYSKKDKPDVEEIYKFIDRIACNTAPAKQEKINCISISMGNGCLDPKRRNCIGCGQEVYLNTSLHLIGEQVRILVEQIAESKTSASKFKSEMLLNQVIKPILSDIITTLKDIYGIKDLSLYKEIVAGVPVKNEIL